MSSGRPNLRCTGCGERFYSASAAHKKWWCQRCGGTLVVEDDPQLTLGDDQELDVER